MAYTCYLLSVQVDIYKVSYWVHINILPFSKHIMRYQKIIYNRFTFGWDTSEIIRIKIKSSI